MGNIFQIYTNPHISGQTHCNGLCGLCVRLYSVARPILFIHRFRGIDTAVVCARDITPDDHRIGGEFISTGCRDDLRWRFVRILQHSIRGANFARNFDDQHFDGKTAGHQPIGRGKRCE